MVEYELEKFPYSTSDYMRFVSIFALHGLEVRGREFKLNLERYKQIESESRLIWYVAHVDSAPVGYSCSFWYTDLHFCERVASDDLWFVRPDWRSKGVGWKLKKLTHQALKQAGVVMVYDTIRSSYDHPKLMKDLGFEPRATQWVKTL